MSGRGRFGRGGRHSNRSGRASGRGFSRSKSNPKNENKSKQKNEKEVKFVPHHMNAKGNYGTYNVVLDYILIKLQ